MHGANGVNDVGGRVRFQYVPMHFRLEREGDFVRAAKCGKNEEADAWIGLADGVYGFRDLMPPDTKIEENEVRLMQANRLYHVGRSAHFRNHLDFAGFCKQRFQTLPHHRMFIGDQNANRGAHRVSFKSRGVKSEYGK